jgi:hypothetical protein
LSCVFLERQCQSCWQAQAEESNFGSVLPGQVRPRLNWQRQTLVGLFRTSETGAFLPRQSPFPNPLLEDHALRAGRTSLADPATIRDFLTQPIGGSVITLVIQVAVAQNELSSVRTLFCHRQI